MKGNKRRLIFKVQTPLFSTEENPQALVYSAGHQHMGNVPVTRGLIEAMKGEPKAFFYGRVRGHRVTIFWDKPAPWKEW